MHFSSPIREKNDVVTEHFGILRYILNNIKEYPFKGSSRQFAD